MLRFTCTKTSRFDGYVAVSLAMEELLQQYFNEVIFEHEALRTVQPYVLNGIAAKVHTVNT